MKKILLIEDDPNDVKKVESILNEMQVRLPNSLMILNHSKDVIPYLDKNTPDLILMDLEIQSESTTTLPLLEKIASSIPIIVTSHLNHYQKPSLRHINVIDFVSKQRLEDQLEDSILRAFRARKNGSAEMFTFPVRSVHEIEEKLLVYNIAYIELDQRDHYRVHMVDHTVLPVHSVSFRKLLHAFRDQNILSLQPVSRNEIINVNNIEKIYKNSSGRIELELIGFPERVFRPGRQWASAFQDLYL